MDFQFNHYTINESATDLRLKYSENSTPQLKKHLTEENNKKIGFPQPDNIAADVIVIGSFADAKAVQHFLQQRLASKATGRNWYLLEYENFGQDIGYQIELNHYKRLDLLNTLDVVYPRFSSENTLIQPRLLAKSAEIFDWLKRGAYVYVGTLLYPIDETILRIIQRETRQSRKEAVEYLDNLKKLGRFIQYTVIA